MPPMPVKKSTTSNAEAEKTRRHARQLLAKALRQADDQWRQTRTEPTAGAVLTRELTEIAAAGGDPLLARVHGLVHEHTRVTWLNARDHLVTLRHALKGFPMKLSSPCGDSL
jgi:hypothetical protein